MTFDGVVTDRDGTPTLGEQGRGGPEGLAGRPRGEPPIRNAAAEALDGVPHQLRQFHFPREAARPGYEADRHAKVRLKQEVRGIRPVERKVAGRDDEATAVRGYCAAVRSALTDDGRPPPEASGLGLRDRLAKDSESIDHEAGKRGSRGN